MRALLVGLILLVAIAAWADERYSVTPGPVSDVVVSYHLDALVLAAPIEGEASVTVVVMAVREDGACAQSAEGKCIQKAVQYRGAAAVDMQNWLNTANLTNLSLRKRILQKLAAEGALPAGVITGLPGIPTPIPVDIGGELLPTP